MLTIPTTQKPDVRRALASIEIAIQILATRPGRIKDRLTEAFQGELFAVDPDDLSAPGVSSEARVSWVGHSQGGLVAQWFLTHLHDPSDPALPEVEHLVTIATPHLGAGAAQLHERLSRRPQGRLLLRSLDGLAAAIEPWLDSATKSCLVAPAGDALQGALHLAGAEATATALAD